MSLAEYLETANMLADLAGGIVRDHWLREPQMRMKPDGTPVTDADLAVEEHMRRLLASRHPGHAILGEEFGASSTTGEYTWVIDPIDGTRQFAARLANFGVLIALCQHDMPVLGMIDQPLAKVRCVAATGAGTHLNGNSIASRSTPSIEQSVVGLANPGSFDDRARSVFDEVARIGAMNVYDGGCLAYMALARGAIDLCLNGADMEPFDICALVPIVEEAGGIITTWGGKRPTMSYSGPIVAAGCARVHAEAMRIITSFS